MHDYLQPVSKIWRILSILACALASFLSLLTSLWLWTDMIQRQSLQYDGKPLWVGAVTISVIGISTAFIAWRLLCHHYAGNGVTSLPTRFIQLFGIVLLVGLGCVAYYKGKTSFIIEGISICLAMIFVSRNIAKRQRLPRKQQ